MVPTPAVFLPIISSLGEPHYHRLPLPSRPSWKLGLTLLPLPPWQVMLAPQHPSVPPFLEFRPECPTRLPVDFPASRALLLDSLCAPHPVPSFYFHTLLRVSNIAALLPFYTPGCTQHLGLPLLCSTYISSHASEPCLLPSLASLPRAYCLSSCVSSPHPPGTHQLILQTQLVLPS